MMYFCTIVKSPKNFIIMGYSTCYWPSFFVEMQINLLAFYTPEFGSWWTRNLSCCSQAPLLVQVHFLMLFEEKTRSILPNRSIVHPRNYFLNLQTLFSILTKSKFNYWIISDYIAWIFNIRLFNKCEYRWPIISPNFNFN